MICFIQRGKDGPIKIGYSTDPVARLTTLRTSNPEPLRLVAFTPGGRDVERALHVQFEEGRMEGEWFRPDTPGLAEEMLRAGHGEYLVHALGEADEMIGACEQKARSWQRRRDEIVEEILAYCAGTPKREAA